MEKYPPELKKKVTLMSHFTEHLVRSERQRRFAFLILLTALPSPLCHVRPERCVVVPHLAMCVCSANIVIRRDVWSEDGPKPSPRILMEALCS